MKKSPEIPDFIPDFFYPEDVSSDPEIEFGLHTVRTYPDGTVVYLHTDDTAVTVLPSENQTIEVLGHLTEENISHPVAEPPTSWTAESV